MATSIYSEIGRSKVDYLLSGDSGSSRSTVKTLDSSNGVYKDVRLTVEERLVLHCPHSFSVSEILCVTPASSVSRRFRSALSSLSNPRPHLLFHGTKESNHVSIFDNGFSLSDNHYGDTDTCKGYIGKGVYLSSFPEYCAAYIKETVGITHLKYYEPVQVGVTCKLLGCIALVGRTRQLHQKEFGTDIEATLESRWAWVQDDGEVASHAAQFFAQEYAIKCPEHVYPRFKISLTRVTKELVWFDLNLTNPENNRYLAELRQERTVSVYATDSSQKALDALKKKKNGVCYRAVTAGHKGEELVRSMRSAGVHCDVMVFCRSVDYHKGWAKTFSHVSVTDSAAEFKKFATWK